MIAPGSRRGILGQAVNLSPGGMLVATPTPLAVGVEILCDVTLPGGAKTLRGRVARLHPLPSMKTSVAIIFVDLSTRDAAALRAVVARQVERAQTVLVRFEGTSRPVRSSALLTDDGFLITTPLPFLRLDSGVDVATSPEASVITRGFLRRVELEPDSGDGVPRLLIDVRLIGTRAEEGDLAASGAHRTADLRPPHPGRRLRRTKLLALGAGALAIGALAQALVGGPSAWRRASAPPAPAMSRTATAARPGTDPEADPPLLASRPSGAAAAAPAARAPALAGTGRRFTAAVPIAGSLEGARDYRLTSPEGVAFNLPHARARLPFGTYQVQRGGFTVIWVRPLRGGGTHLRFLFARPAPAHARVDLTPEAAGVSVDVTPAPSTGP